MHQLGKRRRRHPYGADCSPTEALADFAVGVELMLVEATLPRPERTGIRGHLTPAEAGPWRAPRARSRSSWALSDKLDASRARDEAAARASAAPSWSPTRAPSTKSEPRRRPGPAPAA